MTPYHAEPRGAGYAVVAEDGRVVLGCADERTAEHWAAVLNQAYRRGYRAGRSDGRGVAATSESDP